jgi:hypothetical protein
MREEKRSTRAGTWYPQKLAYKYPVDPKYTEDGGDSRWQIKPNPFFRPTASTGILPGSKPPAGVRIADGEDDWLNELMTPPKTPEASNSFDGMLSSGDFFPLQRLLSSQICRSTETSPQVSKEDLSTDANAVTATKTAEPIRQMKKHKPPPAAAPPVPPEPIPVPVIEDEDFLARRIRPNFWKYNFDPETFKGVEEVGSDGEVADEDEDPKLIRGKSYKFSGILEHSWLPARNVKYHVRRNLSLPRIVSEAAKAKGVPKASAAANKQTHPPIKPMDKRTKKTVMAFLRKEKWEKEVVQPMPEPPLADYAWARKKYGLSHLRRLSTKEPNSDEVTDSGTAKNTNTKK